MSDMVSVDAIKGYLSQYQDAIRKRHVLERRLKVLGKEVSESAPMWGWRTDEYRERLASQAASVQACALQVMEVLDFLPVSSIEREVLEMRYIDGLSWERISITECLGRSTVFRKVDQAYSTLLEHQRVRELVEAWQSRQAKD